MKKRIRSLSLALFLVAALLPLPAQAEAPRIVGEPAVVSAGYQNTGFVDNHNTLWMWGSNEYGQLGSGGGANGYREDPFNGSKLFPSKMSPSRSRA